MVMGRIRVMLKHRPNLTVDVIGPRRSALRTQPEDIVPGVFATGRVRWIEADIIANALVTRYDFNVRQVKDALGLGQPSHQRYDVVYVNDPMLLRSYKALFSVYGRYQPKFAVHSHFVDVPSCPKFPIEASLWMGQCEASRKADVNFWQCETAMKQAFDEMIREYQPDVVRDVMHKSFAWDDGYSIDEITSPINHNNVRFDTELFKGYRKQGDAVIFVPNRIGGRGRSSDYTNCGRFMFDILPELSKRNRDFIVVAGNPSQKFSNAELEQELGRHGYVNLVPDAFNRDEYKFIASHSDIVVGLYDQDMYGGTASRECIELGCVPLWLRFGEYTSLARAAQADGVVLADGFDRVVDVADSLIRAVGSSDRSSLDAMRSRLQTVVRNRCSYEQTTPDALRRMGL